MVPPLCNIPDTVSNVNGIKSAYQSGDLQKLVKNENPDILCIQEIKTVCWCGKKAICNMRYNEDGVAVKEGEQIVLGANDKYVSVCRKHFKEGNLGPLSYLHR